MLRLTSNVDSSVCVSEMKDGDVAIITNWVVQGYIGRVVQRYDDVLLTLNTRSCCGEYFSSGNISPYNRVRILKKGETLVVE